MLALEFLFNALQAFGNAAVPINMLVLGGSLASIPSFRAVHWPSTLAAAGVRLVLCPALVYGLVAGLCRAGAAQRLAPGPGPLHAMLVVVVCLVSATPTDWLRYMAL